MAHISTVGQGGNAPALESELYALHIIKRGQGLHHLGVEVDGLVDFIAELESKGISVPVKDLANSERIEAVVSPRDAFGVVLQLVDWLENEDPPLESRMDRVAHFKE